MSTTNCTDSCFRIFTLMTSMTSVTSLWIWEPKPGVLSFTVTVVTVMTVEIYMGEKINELSPPGVFFFRHILHNFADLRTNPQKRRNCVDCSGIFSACKAVNTEFLSANPVCPSANQNLLVCKSKSTRSSQQRCLTCCVCKSAKGFRDRAVFFSSP